jgi:hypothetical protein
MRGQVKKGKGQSLGLHGTSGKAGRRCDRRLGLEEGDGKGIRGLVGRLGLLATRWVGLKATGPKGQIGRRAAGPTGPKYEKETFLEQKMNF